MDRLLATANRSYSDLLACALVVGDDLSQASLTEFVEIINRVNASGSEFASGFCAAVRYIVASGCTVPPSMIMFADGNAILAAVGVTSIDVSWSKAQRAHVVRPRTVRSHQTRAEVGSTGTPVASEQGRRSRRRGGRGRAPQTIPTRILTRDDARSHHRGAVRDIEHNQRPPARIAALTYADATKVINALREDIRLPEHTEAPVDPPHSKSANEPVTPVDPPHSKSAELPHLLTDVDWA